jgi:hypothetical protein
VLRLFRQSRFVEPAKRVVAMGTGFRPLFRALLRTPLLICLFMPLAVTPNAYANDNHLWSGLWNAEDTLIVIRVIRYENEFIVEPVETMGLTWTTRKGIINGDTATIEVEYQGVIGRVFIQLLDERNAVARALSCQPDYHVICALVHNQQARFLKLDPALAEQLRLED